MCKCDMDEREQSGGQKDSVKLSESGVVSYHEQIDDSRRNWCSACGNTYSPLDVPTSVDTEKEYRT